MHVIITEMLLIIVVCRTFGNTTLERVVLTGIEDAYSKHGTDSESKGVKAHFRMDDSGVLYLDKVCFSGKIQLVVMQTAMRIGTTATRVMQ